MTRNKVVLAVGLGLVALLALTPLAGAKARKGAAPNLVVTKVSKPPAGATVGSKLKLVVKVRNEGAATAGKSKLALYLAKGRKHKPKDKRLKRTKMRPLGSGRIAKLKLTATLPEKTAPGTYRLIVCADDRNKVHESKEGDNCARTRKFKVSAPVPGPPPPAAAAAPAFTMTDGLDWSFIENAKGESLEAGDPVTATLRAANGLPGQAGYVRSAVASEGFLAGTTASFDFNTSEEEDDGQVTLALPFAFPFGGINEETASVGTNGWISFGSPAVDYWDDDQPSDYRGPVAVVGDFERGIMPYWADLDVRDQGAGAGSVKEVIAADGSSVAFQWDVGQHPGGGVPRRVFQVVLYRDGRFRLDYPGVNTPGGSESFIGYSLGTGPAGVDVIGVNGSSVPPSSFLFTPRPVAAGTALAAGQTTLTLPAGSAFLGGSPGCAAVTAPGPLTAGLASCPVPAVAPGQQATQTVTFAEPGPAPGESRPANFRFLGTYLSGPVALKNGKEINMLTSSLEPSSIAVISSYAGPTPPETGVQAKFATQVNSSPTGLDEPTATFDLPANTTLDSITIENQPIPCGNASPTQVTCQLPSGTNGTQVLVVVTPSAAAKASALTLGVTAQALNAAAASASATSPTVVEGP
jgi:hypothetical protein